MSKDKKLKGKRVEYGIRSIRISDEAYRVLKEARKDSDSTWNKFILDIIKLYYNKE